ncbi:hypothetical protein Sme01_31910 [Sphaerisporangium melleum]|uniref:Alpha/beta hydrolase fold-3 domain-containing protein n=1 Tax=Sphaerisporangium melleum TaxID=321316 RepID=A0A917VMN1_9ACTN|nr:alpha/beta hydrolase fold domain-containing protein [Sphaerisporangium melleum]GGK96407.1 hypothetical protein GCM10007964_43330 [Sphaerisporangium melleum]GII70715.1 hypothetical protein Sme01_31910 [Sphaerisporangium melleum]
MTVRQVPWAPLTIAAAGREVRARLLEPPGRRGWLVWAHGGSWVRGSVAEWHTPVAELALTAGCAVVNVEYRLAPRHRHPAPVDDVLAALDWAHAEAAAEPEA